MVQLSLLAASVATAFVAVSAAPGDTISTTDSFIGFGARDEVDKPKFNFEASYDSSTDTVSVVFSLRTNRGGVNNRFPHFSLGVVSDKLFCNSPNSESSCIPDPTLADGAGDAVWTAPDGGDTLNGKIAMYLATKYLFVSSRYSQNGRLGTCKVLLVDQLCNSYDTCSALDVTDNDGFFLAKGRAIADDKFTDVTDQVTLSNIIFRKNTGNGGRSHNLDGTITFPANLFGSGAFKFVKDSPTYITWNQFFSSPDDKSTCSVTDAATIYQGERAVKQFLPHTSSRKDGFEITMITTEPPTGSPTSSPTTAAPTASPTGRPTLPPVPTAAPTTLSPTAAPTGRPTLPPVPTAAPTTGSPSASPTVRPTSAPVSLPCPREREWYNCRIVNSWWSHIGNANTRENRIKNACKRRSGCTYCANSDPSQENCQPAIGRDGSRMSNADVCSGTPGAPFEEPRCVQFETCPTAEEMTACRLVNTQFNGFKKRKCEGRVSITRQGKTFTAGSRRCAYNNGVCRAVGSYYPFRKMVTSIPGLFDRIRSCPYHPDDPNEA